MAFVADNPVVVAWFVASQGSAETVALLDRAVAEDVHVPAIWEQRQRFTRVPFFRRPP